jgi:hypothetical protein
MVADRLLISCRSCRRHVVLVRNVNTAALNVLATHLRCLHRDDAPREQSSSKELLRRFRVAREQSQSTMRGWPA